MHDLYTRLAQSNIGKTVFEGVGLPSPPILKRSPESSLEKPRGRLLVAGGLRSKVLRKLCAELAQSEAALFTPYWVEPAKAGLFSKSNTSKETRIEQVNFAQQSNHKFKGLIFDASGFNNTGDLNALYVFYNAALKHLKRNGRIIVISASERDCETAEQFACIEACRSFVRSIAKEVGAKGASANLVEVETGAEKNAYNTVAFFLSRKSSYVTGQSLLVSKARHQASTWHKPLKGKTALVTGAAMGIGAETARILARDGAVVICLDIPSNQAALTQFASSIGGHALAIDLSADEAVDTLVQAITSQLGILDIIVHNAGITRDKTLKNMSNEQWTSVLNINLNRIVQLNKALLERKALNKNGRIIGVSSISGIAGNFGQTNYACSKGGVAGYTKAFATTLEGGITINAVAPGFIETRMTGKVPFLPREIGRRSNSFSQGGLPLDVAEVIAFLCQPSAQSLNGNVLRVCGQSLLGR